MQGMILSHHWGEAVLRQEGVPMLEHLVGMVEVEGCGVPDVGELREGD